jgi:hypothetical protein
VTYPPPEQPQPSSGPPISGPPTSGPPSGPVYPGPPYPGPAYGEQQPPYYAAPPYGPQPAPAKGGRTWIWIAAGVATLLVLCIAGGVALVLAARQYSSDTAGSPVVTPAPFDRSGEPWFDPDDEIPEVDEPLPEPTVLKLGDTLVLTSDKGDQFEVTVKNKKFRKKGCDPYSPKSENGGYLIADVAVKVTKGKADVSPFDFDLVTPDGTTMDNSGGIRSQCGNDLDYVQDLKAGGKRSGQLVFDVGSPKGEITFKVDGAVAGSWKVG